MDILQLYVSILNAAQMIPDSDGVIYRQIKLVDDSRKPVIVAVAGDKKAAMVMPIKNQTDKGDWEGRVAFHPLRENTNRGESVVMEEYRTTMLKRLNVALMQLMSHLLRLAASSDKQSSYSPDFLALLSKLPKADTKAVENFDALLAKCGIGNSSVLWVFIKRSGIKDAITYKRVASVSVPLLEAVTESKDRKVNGVQLRIADVECIKALYEIVLPQAKGIDMSYYSHGSNSMRAPTMDAFMNAIRKIGENINDLAMHFDDAINESVSMDMKWCPIFEEIDAYSPRILTIPALPGNEGRVLNEKVESVGDDLPAWEPASAEPSNVGRPSRNIIDSRISRRDRDSDYGREPVRESRYRATPAKSNDDVMDSPFYRALAKEREAGGSRRISDSYRDRDSGRGRDDGLDANGYETAQRNSRRPSYGRSRGRY